MSNRFKPKSNNLIERFNNFILRIKYKYFKPSIRKMFNGEIVFEKNRLP